MSIRTDKLLATDRAVERYRGDHLVGPMFRAAVDLIDAYEREGRDPWEAVREALLGMDETISRQTQQIVEALNAQSPQAPRP